MITDITFCTNSTCPLKDKCKRGEEQDDWIHNYANFAYVDDSKSITCEFFIPKESQWQQKDN